MYNRLFRKMNIVDNIFDFDKIAKKHDILIFLSGSYFMEDAVNEDLYNERMNLVKAFKRLNKPVYILGTNFGPYKTEDFFNKHIDLFEKCDDVCFRDSYSYNLFLNLKNVRKANDIVLHLDIEKYSSKSEDIIGFSIMDFTNREDLKTYKERYINSIVKSIELCVSKGYRCVLMSFCEKEGDKKAIDDILKLVNNKYKSSINIFEYKYNVEESLYLISKFKLFIATRFHASILAIKFNIPLISIIYNQKTRFVLQDLKLDNVCIDLNQIDRIYDEKYLEERLNQGNYVEYEGLNLQFEKLDKIL